MHKTSEAIDLHKHLVDRDFDSRIKSSRDDMLRIMQADIRVLDTKIDNRFEVLDTKIDSNFIMLNSKIERLDDRINQVISMRKWAVGMFVVILLAITAPYIAAFFG